MSAADFPPGGPEAKSSLSSLLRILLIVSLALNTFFLGAGAVLLGRMLADRHPHPSIVRMRSDFPGPGRMMRTLSAETRARIESQIRPEDAAMRAAMMAAQRARREAFVAFSAEPFSAEALRQKLAAAETADAEAVHAAHNVLAAAITQLTPEERAKLVAEFKAHPVGPEMRGGPRPDRPPDGPPPSAP
jgi:uncharacterized membrane protein